MTSKHTPLSNHARSEFRALGLSLTNPLALFVLEAFRGLEKEEDEDKRRQDVLAFLEYALVKQRPTDGSGRELFRLFDLTCRHNPNEDPESFVDIFRRLYGGQLLCPLTGEEDEWTLVSETGSSEHNPSYTLFQNRRDYRVFKKVFPDGKVTYAQTSAILYRCPSGACYSTHESVKEITSWPYSPQTEYVDVEAQQDDEEDPQDDVEDSVVSGDVPIEQELST